MLNETITISFIYIVELFTVGYIFVKTNFGKIFG